MMNNYLTTRYQIGQLEDCLRDMGNVAIAVSGGVDSMTLAYIAHRVNRKNTVYHAVSPAVPVSATARVKRYAALEHWQLYCVSAGEMQDHNYRRNPVNRCYFCKSNLYASLSIESGTPIVSGTNTDDLQDFRPGLQAAQEFNVRHPYVEVGIDKEAIRAIAKHFQLHDLHDLPASPCLASRVTTGVAIDEQLLPLIDDVETALWQSFAQELNLLTVRCRIEPQSITIQLQGNIDFDNNAVLVERIQNVARQVLSAGGYPHAHPIAVEPYRPGSAFLVDHITAINI